MERLRKAQYYELPDESKHKKKRFALQSHECTNFDELNRRIKEWDKSMGFTATNLVKVFDIKGSNAAHKVKLLAMELNPTIPGLEIKSKSKSTKKHLAGSTLSMPVPPNRKKLAKIDASIVESGQLKISIPCVPVSMKRCIKGEIRVIEDQSRKFSLADIRQSILNCHEQFMRLHTVDHISAMGKDEVLSLLNDHPMVSCNCNCNCELSTAPLEELKARLIHYERNRMLWVWHDHSSLVSHAYGWCFV